MKYVALLLLLLGSAAAKSPHAPLHDELLTAKTVYLSGQPSVLDKAAGELQKWGRFSIVGTPDNADLIFEFSYWSQGDNGLRDQQETMVIKSRKTGDVIYQDSRHHEPSGIFTLVPHSMASSMIKELRKRMEPK